jgi:hypothetical protein
LHAQQIQVHEYSIPAMLQQLRAAAQERFVVYNTTELPLQDVEYDPSRPPGLALHHHALRVEQIEDAKW